MYSLYVGVRNQQGLSMMLNIWCPPEKGNKGRQGGIQVISNDQKKDHHEDSLSMS